MKFHKRSFKLRRISKNEDSSREKSNQMRKMRKRKKKDTFHQPKKKKKSVFNHVKKNESTLERIKGYQGEIQIHPG